MRFYKAKIILLSSVLGAGFLANPANAVYGGVSGLKNEVVVALTKDRLDTEAMCTAGLIAPRVVVTAAHCINGPAESYWVTAPGADLEDINLTKIQGKEIFMSKKFSLGQFPYQDDFAVILLKSPFPKIKPLKIATSEEVAKWISEEASVTHIGYGRYEKLDSSKSGLALVTSSIPYTYETNFSKKVPFQFDMLTSGTYSLTKLTVDKTICGGDSGGPLIKKVGSEWVYVGAQSASNGAGCIAPCEEICVANQFLAASYTEILSNVKNYLTEDTKQVSTKSKSIKCIKGKNVKVISGTNPKCPTGYKKT